MAPNKTAPAGWTPARGDDHIYKPTESSELPAGRLRELRRAGHDIAMTMEERASPAGELHRVGVYRLAAG